MALIWGSKKYLPCTIVIAQCYRLKFQVLLLLFKLLNFNKKTYLSHCGFLSRVTFEEKSQARLVKAWAEQYSALSQVLFQRIVTWLVIFIHLWCIFMFFSDLKFSLGVDAAVVPGSADGGVRWPCYGGTLARGGLSAGFLLWIVCSCHTVLQL